MAVTVHLPSAENVSVAPVTAHEPVAEYVTGNDDVDDPVNPKPVGE